MYPSRLAKYALERLGLLRSRRATLEPFCWRVGCLQPGVRQRRRFRPIPVTRVPDRQRVDRQQSLVDRSVNDCNTLVSGHSTSARPNALLERLLAHPVAGSARPSRDTRCRDLAAAALTLGLEPGTPCDGRGGQFVLSRPAERRLRDDDRGLQADQRRGAARTTTRRGEKRPSKCSRRRRCRKFPKPARTTVPSRSARSTAMRTGRAETCGPASLSHARSCFRRCARRPHRTPR